MTPKQASHIIGCSATQVRALIRGKKIKAKRIATPSGHCYNISQEEAERYRDTPQNGGWPRGQSYEYI